VGSEVMTAEEVAEFLRVPVATLYQWKHRRVGPPAARVGRWLRYRRRDVEQWLTAQTDKSA
jgi:excisionase family DNA binding protein